MLITRDKANRLLTQPEMGLFGDSRNPVLRGLSEKALVSRVDRTRKLRDKSRDLFQRQKLKTRDRTGSKTGTFGVANQRTSDKGEILDDILQRFESRLKEVQSGGESDAATAKKKPARKPASTSSAKSGTSASAKPSGKSKSSAPAKTARTAKATTKLTSKPAKHASTAKGKDMPGKGNSAVNATTKVARSKKEITPKRALKNTRALLDAKQQRERQPPAYLAIDTHAEAQQPDTGFQSGTAKAKARKLHEGESRMDPIHGSISTQGRQNQGKRDKR